MTRETKAQKIRAVVFILLLGHCRYGNGYFNNS